MTSALAVLASVFTCYVIGTPRERRQLSRRQKLIIRYYRA